MDQNINHIISKFSWDTCFDRKEKAFELQERISNWSRTGMPRELADIFDKICPAEQTWRIKSLEIDLGEVDFDNLEFELSSKLRWKLNESLSDMINNSNQNQQNIELVDEKFSQLELIRDFLLHGLMRWNYQPAYGCVNEMLSNLLRSDMDGVISMVKETGATHENVRKRIAWQFNESNIVKIITGLEPNYHNEIVEFSVELIRVQEQETVVKSNVRELKKNIWFWILNFLMNERGTLFNKVAFMKSTLKQMAAAHNISYDELLELIELATDKLSKRFTIKTDFITTLKLLSKEKKNQEKHAQVQRNTDYWQLLEHYFNNPESRRSPAKVIEFNELVAAFTKQDHPKFREFILSFKPDEQLWHSVLTDLKISSFKAIVSAITPANSGQLLKSFDFLDALTGSADIKLLQKITLRYLQSHNGTFTEKDFFNYFNTSLTKIGSINKHELWERLIEKKIPYIEKTISNSSIFSAFISSFDQTTHSDSITQSESFQKIIDGLVKEFKKGSINKTSFSSLQRLAVKYIQFSPKAGFTILLNYPDKAVLQKLIPYITDNSTARLLIQASNPKVYDDLLQIEQLFNQFKIAGKYSQTNSTSHESLFTEALNSLIFYPDLKDSIVKFVFSRISGLISTAEFNELNLFAGQYLSNPLFTAINSSIIVEGEKIASSVLARVEQLIKAKANKYNLIENKQALLAQLLVVNYNDRELTALRTGTDNRQILIVNYLLKDGIKLMDELVKKYSTILKLTLDSVDGISTINQLRGLYWQCLLSYSEYSGNAGEFRSLFGVAVWYHYPTLKHIGAVDRYQNTGNIVEEIDKLINEPVSKHYEVIKRLTENLNSSWIVKLKKSDSKQGIVLKNYFLPNGDKIKDELIKEYSATSMNAIVKGGTQRHVVEQLNELYWECLLKYNKYNGDAGLFKKLFKAVFELKYPVLIKSAVNNFNAKELSVAKSKEYTLKSGDILPIGNLLQYIKSCLQKGNDYFSHNERKYYLSELLTIALEENPGKLREVINDIAFSDKQIKQLSSSISFNHFSLWISNDAHSAETENIQTVGALFNMVHHFVPANMSNELMVMYWKQVLKIMKGHAWSSADKKKLVTDSFSFIADKAGLTMGAIISSLKKNGYTISPPIHSIISEYLPIAAVLQLNEIIINPNEKLARAEQVGLLDSLIDALVIQRQISGWFDKTNAGDEAVLLNEVVIHYPLKFLCIMQRQIITGQQMFWLGRSINFKKLLTAIAGLNRPQQSILYALEKLHQSFGTISISGISAEELQYILFKKVIKAWSSGNWEIVLAKNIWNELLWEVCNKKGVSQKAFFMGIDNIKFQLPASLQVSYKFFKNTSVMQKKVINDAVIKIPKLNPQKNDTLILAKAGITVKNAGAVLLNNYIIMLFERLGLINNKNFANSTAQAEAVHYLQYVITGLTQTDESLLALNKVLCGLPLAEPVHDGINISPANVKLIDGLITAIIGYWPAIGQCSVNGFRGNWLVRNGLLVEQEERWELTVEKRAYDLLINKSPFSFSIIKYPWMVKPLHVYWAY
ncbi:contractile injection system tape measure protein [Mucilaginibacter sp. L196]|uniref:contractile injection system tape measure protein n=1 Tax=Mucilaginibacter sp. L196 TaxID=1641870 RepID=UPI00131DD334|nr:contractile injection system tape measure protein [Mucilaginibacter sp. L196]